MEPVISGKVSKLKQRVKKSLKNNKQTSLYGIHNTVINPITCGTRAVHVNPNKRAQTRTNKKRNNPQPRANVTFWAGTAIVVRNMMKEFYHLFFRTIVTRSSKCQ